MTLISIPPMFGRRNRKGAKYQHWLAYISGIVRNKKAASKDAAFLSVPKKNYFLAGAAAGAAAGASAGLASSFFSAFLAFLAFFFLAGFFSSLAGSAAAGAAAGAAGAADFAG